MKKRAVYTVLAVILAAVACNLPMDLELTPVFEPPSPTAGSSVATFTPAFSHTQTEPPGATTALTPLPTLTLASTLTAAASITPLPTLTVASTLTSTPSPVPTLTTSPASPTPPPTITVPAAPTRTRTAIGAPSTRAIYNATYFDTPPVLDGIWDEWKDRSNEYPAGAVVFGGANWSGDTDLEASFRAAWDEDYLYLAVKVKDDVYVQNAAGNLLYEGDSIEVLLDTKPDADYLVRSLSADDFQLGISPGNPSVDGTREAYLWFPRSLTGVRTSVKIAAVQQSGVYRVEAAIPWSVFEITPASGARFGFALSVSDNDNGGANAQQSMVSNAPGRVLVDPTTWTELRLK